MISKLNYELIENHNIFPQFIHLIPKTIKYFLQFSDRYQYVSQTLEGQCI